MDGVIAVGLGSDNKLLEHIASFKLPMVVVNRFFPVNKYTGCVRADMSQWVLDEIAALKQLQCNNILVLNKSSNSDAGREIAAALENITKQSSNQVDMITMSDNLLPQLLNLLHPVLQYDGFIINGSEGNLLQQLATQLDIPQSRLTISHFSSTRKPDIGGRSWYRNGHTMGVQGWELLHDMLTGRSEGREIRLPVVSPRQHLRAESKSEYGFDL